MKRSDFLKKLGIGLGVAVVAPQVLAGKDDFSERKDAERIINANDECGEINIYKLPPISVALFLNGKEVKYKGYQRMQTEWTLKGGAYKPQNVSFPLTPKNKKIQADEAWLFNNKQECIGIVPFGQVSEVFHGIMTVEW